MHMVQSIGKKRINWSIWPKGETLKCTITLDQSGPGNNDNEGVLYTPKISRIRSLLADAV